LQELDMNVKNETLSECAKEIMRAVRYLQIKWTKPFSYLLHLTFVLWPAMGDATVDVLVAVGETMAMGEGWLFGTLGTSGPQNCTPSENPHPLQEAHDSKEVMVNRWQ
jgi:hypothetical protein